MHFLKIIIISAFILFFSSSITHAYWVWTPETHKWTNPKNEAKDVPKEQFDWAMNFFNKTQYKRAIKEFRKLIAKFPQSSYAAESQFYIGECYLKMNKQYPAYEEYQKTIEKYPGTTRMSDILKRELDIADYFFNKNASDLLVVTIPKTYEYCIQIYNQILKNAPYSECADKAQFYLAESYRLSNQFDLAMEAYKKLGERYPESSFAAEARYKTVFCASHQNDKTCDSAKSMSALKEYEEAAKDKGEIEKVEQNKKEMLDLLEKNAKKIYETAAFYEKQKIYKAAFLYYEEVSTKFPETSYAALAKDKVSMLRKTKKVE